MEEGSNLHGLFGLALMIGLVVWYVVQRRAVKRRDVPVPMMLDSDGIAAEQVRRHSVGELLVLPFIFAFLLFIVKAHVSDVWGIVWSAVFLVMTAVIGCAAVLDLVRSFQRASSHDWPRTWLGAVVIGYGVLPALGWFMVAVWRRSMGILMPFISIAIFGLLIGLGSVGGSFKR